MGMLPPDARVYVAGHRGMVGSAIWRSLHEQGFSNLVGWASSEVDLADRDSTMDAIRTAEPDVVVMAAAKVGGIGANQAMPVEFLNENLKIQTNVFEAAHEAQVDRLLFVGSSCIYPRACPQPMHESSLLTGPLEPTNQSYAIAKIAGLQAVRSYRAQYGRRWISAMPTNLYGPGDNFNEKTAHVLPALIRRFHRATEDSRSSVTLWGTGSPRREFLHVNDLAAAVILLLDTYDEDEHINVGVGEDVTVAELAAIVAGAVGFAGDISWDASQPDGMPRKLLDVSRINALGWQADIGLRDGVKDTFDWYLSTLPSGLPSEVKA